MCLQHMNPVENTLPEEKLKKKDQIKKNHYYAAFIFKYKMNSTGCSDAGEGRGAERAG